MSDPERRETQGMRWADCEEREKEKETGEEGGRRQAGGARGKENAGGARGEEAREARAQEEREKGVSAREEQVEAQQGHEGEDSMTTQKKCVEEQKETNSMHEQHDVSNRHIESNSYLLQKKGMQETIHYQRQKMQERREGGCSSRHWRHNATE